MGREEIGREREKTKVKERKERKGKRKEGVLCEMLPSMEFQ